MDRKWAVCLGVALGVFAGWSLSRKVVERHRTDLFSPQALKRLAALTGLAGKTGVETVRLLRDYLEWERHPALRRRARAMVRRMEAALG